MSHLPRPPHGGIFCHLITRGVNREPIFRDDDDRRAFMVRLHRVLVDGDFVLAADCLMTNHLHLVAKAVVSLSVGMGRLLSSYAQYFNERWGRVGPLFQDRFMLKRCLTDAYLKRVIPYVHMNPVKAGMVDHPADWKWSSYREYLNPSGSGRTDRASVLRLFEPGEYEGWLNSDGVPGELSGDRFLPDEDDGNDYELVPIVSLEELAMGAASALKLPLVEFGRSKVRPVAAARREFIADAARTGYRGSQIARVLGLSPAAVSMTLSRARAES